MVNPGSVVPNRLTDAELAISLTFPSKVYNAVTIDEWYGVSLPIHVVDEQADTVTLVDEAKVNINRESY